MLSQTKRGKIWLISGLILALFFGILLVINRGGKFTLSPAPIAPLDVDLFDSVGQDIGVFSEVASFFDEQEEVLEEINMAYEDK